MTSSIFPRSAIATALNIQWSEEDQAYVVTLPEWGDFAKTHGETYEEAAKNARRSS